MKKDELTKALAIAQSDQDLSGVDIEVLHGLYLKTFPPTVSTTLTVVAKLLRELVVYFNGHVDSDALDEFANVSRRKILIVG